MVAAVALLRYGPMDLSQLMEIIYDDDPEAKQAVKIFGTAKKWLMTQPEIEVYKPKPQTQPLVLSARLCTWRGDARGVGGKDASLSERSTGTTQKTVWHEPGVAVVVALLRYGPMKLSQVMEITYKADPEAKKAVKVAGTAKKWLMTHPEIEVYKPKPQTQPLVLSARLRTRPGGKDASLS